MLSKRVRILSAAKSMDFTRVSGSSATGLWSVNEGLEDFRGWPVVMVAEDMDRSYRGSQNCCKYRQSELGDDEKGVEEAAIRGGAPEMKASIAEKISKSQISSVQATGVSICQWIQMRRTLRPSGK